MNRSILPGCQCIVQNQRKCGIALQRMSVTGDPNKSLNESKQILNWAPAID